MVSKESLSRIQSAAASTAAADVVRHDDTRLSATVGSHEAAGDPHPQYLTQTEGDARYIEQDGNSTLTGDLTVAGTGKGYRLRRSGGALDLEGGGASLHFSMWTGGDFTGTQTPVFIADPDGSIHFQGIVSVPDPSVDANATSRGWVNTQLAGRVPTSRSISPGTGLTGGGDLSADRTLTVSYGSGAGTSVQGNDARVTADQAAGTASIRTLGSGALQACAGNDSRLSDARTPTAHVHAGTDITTGTVGTARLPNLLTAVRTVAPSGGTISIDANTAGNNIDSTLTGDATLNVPTNGASGQSIQGTVLASGAQRVLTFHASFGRLTGIAATLTVPSGKLGRYSIRRTDLTGSAKWLLEAVGVEQ